MARRATIAKKTRVRARASLGRLGRQARLKATVVKTARKPGVRARKKTTIRVRKAA